MAHFATGLLIFSALVQAFYNFYLLVLHLRNKERIERLENERTIRITYRD